MEFLQNFNSEIFSSQLKLWQAKDVIILNQYAALYIVMRYLNSWDTFLQINVKIMTPSLPKLTAVRSLVDHGKSWWHYVLLIDYCDVYEHVTALKSERKSTLS